MLTLFYIVLIVLAIFDFGGKSRSWVANIVSIAVRATIIIMTILTIWGLLIKNGVL